MSDGAAGPVLLSGGNPQITKGEGEAPVRAYIVAMPGWKRAAGERLDALAEAAIPDVRRAVKWNQPLYGMDGVHWAFGFRGFDRYVKAFFFDGAALVPPPPVASRQDRVRYLQVHEGDALDEAQVADWLAQAARLPGEKL